MAAGVAAFWSYVHADDDADDGRITQLSADLRAQFRKQTAEELELFLDRDSIEWGEAWDERIDEAIAGTTFFIPIVTPSYFQSNQCRQELLKFVRDATRLGLEQLLMPVYWVTVPEIEAEGEESRDEAIVAVATHQWADLREASLEDRSSAVYRKSVFGLAEELAKRTRRIAESSVDLPAAGRQDVPELAEDAPGILENIAESEEALPRLSEVLQAINEAIVAMGTMAEQASAELEAAAARGVGMKAALAVTERLALKLDDPATQIEENGQEFAVTLTRTDPGIQARFDLLDEKDELEGDEVSFAVSVLGMSNAADGALQQMQTMVDQIGETARLSRSLRRPLRRIQNGIQGVLDGRAIMEDWGRRAVALLERHDIDPSEVEIDDDERADEGDDA